MQDYDKVSELCLLHNLKKSIMTNDSHNCSVKDEETPASEANGLASFKGKVKFSVIVVSLRNYYSYY